HTEIALRRFGAEVAIQGEFVEVEGGRALYGQTMTVPGDLSSAAFFVAAALGVRDAQLRIKGVGLNSTRTGCIHLLQNIGAKIAVEGLTSGAGEPTGNLIVENSNLSGLEVLGDWIPNVI